MSGFINPAPIFRRKYKVIYADPPWTFKVYSDKGKGRSAEAHYDCLTLDQIKLLSVKEQAATDAVLLMWVTDPFLEEGLQVIKSWGFTYKTVGFYWAKSHPLAGINGRLGDLDRNEHWPIGTGYWTRA
jgi:N6-adenosine-specific RNA methylase IME4